MAESKKGAAVEGATPVMAIDAALLKEAGLEAPDCTQLKTWLKAIGDGDNGYASSQLRLPLRAKGGARSMKVGLSVASTVVHSAWRPSDAYGDLRSLDKVIATAGTLSQIRLHYSSYDFAAALGLGSELASGDLDKVRRAARQLDSDWPHDLADLRAGMNFAGEAELLTELDKEFRQRIGLGGKVPVAGCVGRANGTSWIELTARLAETRLLSTQEGLSVTLARATIAVAGLGSGKGTPTVSLALHGRIRLDEDQVLEVSIAVDQGQKRLALTANAPRPIEAGSLAKALAPDLGASLKTVMGGASDFVPRLRRLELGTPWSGLDGARAAIWLSYSMPFRLFDLIDITPSAYVSATRNGSATEVQAVLTGEGKIGEGDAAVRFETQLSLPDGQFRANLAEGSVVRLPSAAQAKIDRVARGQALTLIDLAIDGNPGNKTYGLSVITVGFLAFKVGDGRLLIGDLRFNLEMVEDSFSARLEATIGIGEIDVDLEMGLDNETLETKVTVQRLPIGDIAADLLKIEAPGELAQAVLDDVKLELTLGEKVAFAFSATSKSEFTVAGLKLGLTSLNVDYADALTLTGKGKIRFDTAQVEFGLRYAEKNWNFSFDAKTSFDLSRVLAVLKDDLGFESPYTTPGVSVTRIVGAIRLGADGPRIALKFEFKINGRDFSLSLIAARLEKDGKTGWECSLQAGPVVIDFRDLPFVGGPIGRAVDALATSTDKTAVKLDKLSLGVWSTVEKDDLKALFKALPGEHFPEPKPPGGKASLTGVLQLLEYERQIVYPEAKKGDESDKKALMDAKGGDEAPKTDGASEAPAPASGAKGAGATPPGADLEPKPPAVAEPSWIDLKRDIGPVRLDRVGFSIDESKKLSVFVDAGTKIGPVQARVVGLKVTTPVLGGFSPEFEISGVDLSCKTDVFSLSGALLATPSVPNDYSGVLSVKVRTVTIKAIGAYAEVGGSTSFFVFVVLLAPIFATPPFQLTGIAGGFGLNFIVRLPERPQDVAGFPLVALMKSSDDDDKPLAQLGKFRNALEHAPGGWCLAFGVTFTLAQMVECIVLAVVEVRSPNFAISFAGLADMPLRLGKPTLGKTPKALGHIQLAIAGRYSSAEKTLRILGALTEKSWLLDPSCRLTGGFAVCVWMGGPHEGDFLVSIGGYSPFLKPKSHYPALPRVGFTWAPRTEVTLSGGVYLTLDRYGIQFGLAARLTAETSKITVSAYFSLDALLQWQPLYFQLQIQMGCMVEVRTFVRLRLSLDIDMLAFGPPFGARVTVAVRVALVTVSYTVEIGESADATTPVATIDEVLALASGGRDTLVNFTGAPETRTLAVRAEALALDVTLAIPAREAVVVGAALAPVSQAELRRERTQAIDIRPMQLNDIDSKVTLTVMRNGKPDRAAAWRIEPVRGCPTEAIWYLPPRPSSGDAAERKREYDQRLAAPSGRAAITGLRIRPPAGALKGEQTVKVSPVSRNGPRIAAPAAATPVVAALVGEAELTAAGFDLTDCLW